MYPRGLTNHKIPSIRVDLQLDWATYRPPVSRELTEAIEGVTKAIEGVKRDIAALKENI